MFLGKYVYLFLSLLSLGNCCAVTQDSDMSKQAVQAGEQIKEIQIEDNEDYNFETQFLLREGLNCEFDLDCNAQLKVVCLCVKKLKARCVETDKLNALSVFASGVKSRLGCFEHLQVNERLCANRVRAEELCAQNISVNSICANEARFNNVQVCTSLKATAVFSADTDYTLGQPVNFDAVLEDPNGDVAVGPFSYTAPVDGDYIITVQLDQFDLVGAEPILGAPVVNTAILVNGDPFREAFAPFLAFHNEQKHTLSSLIGLKAGDVLTIAHDVLVMQDNTGFTPYSGTITLSGSGLEANESFFKIHYLSTDCSQQQPCEFVCEPCENICEQIVDRDCGTCH